VIMPNKNIRLEYSLLNCGALVLGSLKTPNTLSSLWENSKKHEALNSYKKFILTLDYLFAIGTITLKNGLIERCRYDKVSP